MDDNVVRLRGDGWPKELAEEQAHCEREMERHKTLTALAPEPRRRWLHLFRRQAPTTFHKCLAVHMHFAKHTSLLR